MTQMVRNWDRDVVEKFIKPESQQKSPDVFRETHVEIDKIRAEILRPHNGDDAFVTEAEFRDAVLSSDLKDDNRIFIVKGEVGSGKSHLCQWLEYEINGYEDGGGTDDEHVAIHISRSNTRLDEILEILHEPIDKEYEEVSDVSSLDPQEVADFIIQGLRTFYKDKGALRSFDLEIFLESRPNADDFRTTLVENIEEYQASVDQENQEQNIQEYLLSREDYGRVCLSAFGETKREDEVYPVVRRAVHDLLTRNIGIEDFKRELEDISDAYVEAGKRPVLICEDLTTFSVLKDDLLDHIFELSSGHYDVIMGWTTGWERENIDDALSTSEDSLTYMKQRTQGYLSMTADNGQAYFLEGRSAPVVLVRAYLDAIKRHSVAAADIPEEVFDNIYPFNEAFVRHVYANLIQDGNLQQTPRILLVHVIAECLTSDVPPFKAIQNNSYVRQRPYLIGINEHSTPCLELTQWYALKHQGQLWLPAIVFEIYDVDTHGGVVRDGNVFFEMSFAAGDVTVIERVPGSEVVIESERTDEENEETEEKDDKPAEMTDEGKDEEEEDERPDQPEQDTVEVPPEDYREFQSWLMNGAEYASVDRFRDGVVATLERWHDPTRLANENSTADSTGIYFDRGSEPPVVVRGADSPSSMSFEVLHGTENEVLYRQMLHYGYADSFEDGANFDKLRGWATDKVVEYRSRMREDIEGHLPKQMSIEEFIVLAHYLVMNIGKGETEISRKLMFESYEMKDTSPLSYKSDIDVDLPQGLDGAFERVSAHTGDIRNLAQGFFLLKKNVVDYDRLNDAVRGVAENDEDYLSELSSTSVDDLADAYRIGTTRNNAKKSLATIIEDFSDFAGELEKVEQKVNVEDLQEDISRYQKLHFLSHNQVKLANLYQTLDAALGPLGVTHRQRWQKVGELLNDTSQDIGLGDFRSTLNEIEKASANDAISAIALLHEYQRSLDESDAWEVYDVFNEMIQELRDAEGSEVGDFRNQVESSTEFDTFRAERDSIRQTIEGDL
ncbi:hypothetical protein BG842_02730 [Haladaptatus sp. W1]|uniref:hypothetical protein n=1 Tax=Haladaptatus sp. W1 TaxID=1897478 RepID=UPI000849B8D6|nr:hypothetical protein [Haladaptatus sp. W1]ODR80172.1 hypothetical protein BG842_02730 [Haladaptatus sp. W1]